MPQYTFLLLNAAMSLPTFVFAAEPVASDALQHQQHQHHQKQQHAAIEQSKPHEDHSQRQDEHSSHQVEQVDHSQHRMPHHGMAHSSHAMPQHQPTTQQLAQQQSTEFSPTALSSLMPAAMVPLADWRQANQQVLEIGGWQFYLQEAAQSSDVVEPQPQKEQHHGHH